MSQRIISKSRPTLVKSQTEHIILGTRHPSDSSQNQNCLQFPYSTACRDADTTRATSDRADRTIITLSSKFSQSHSLSTRSYVKAVFAPGQESVMNWAYSVLLSLYRCSRIGRGPIGYFSRTYLTAVRFSHRLDQSLYHAPFRARLLHITCAVLRIVGRKFGIGFWQMSQSRGFRAVSSRL